LLDRVETGAVEPAYGRFSRRLKALFIDWIIMLSLLVAALFVAVSAGSDGIGRILGFTCAAIVLLYEPLLVSLTGSTIGHYRTNLRVVDNRTHGNISFMKAVVRVVIKSVLGIYSFVTMAATSRHQAVHDLLTQSTVQIRNRSIALPNDYVTARTELLNPAMPSAGRRILVIIVYLAATYVLSIVLTGSVMLAGLISNRCIANQRWCSPGEYSLFLGIGIGLIGIAVLCVIQGWRGRLFGCRIRRNAAPAPDAVPTPDSA
jgi:uncharacterized RDD family membrane protein YckC